MLNFKLLSDINDFAREFERCCHQYHDAIIATAWCGNPKHVLPYSNLEAISGKIRATLGISFGHTHPDAIDFLQSIGGEVRIFRDDITLFHPKMYVFNKGNEVAIFIGSSNLTYSGFYTNIETNVLIEGRPKTTDEKNQINALKKQLGQWYSDNFSFIPSATWIKRYRKIHEKNRNAQSRLGIKTPLRAEEEIASASWLRNADWDTYFKKVIAGLKQRERNGQGYIDVLNAANTKVPLPWTISYFDDPERRRIIGGIGPYGWLGHVAASGRFRHLMAAGERKEKSKIVSIINRIGTMNPPMDWVSLDKLLKKLVDIGPTMKVWGRLLCIVRPDLFCTVASISVRKNLSETLDLPQSLFEQTNGYIQLLKLIHSSPWFNSSLPSVKNQAEIWSRRSAFIDAIFY